MIRIRKRLSTRSAVPLLTTVMLGMASTAWASTTQSVTWTAKEDFEINASTTGTPTSRLNIDTAASPGDLGIGASKDFLTTASVTCATPQRIYTTGVDRKSIAVLDLATKTLKGSILLPSRVAGVVYNPLNNRVYVGHYDDNNVSVIDNSVDPPVIIGTLTSGGSAASGAYAAVFNPTNKKIYVANTADQTVSIFDAEHDQLAPKTVAVMAGATTATFDADNDKVYFTSKGNQFVTVIDGALDTAEDIQVDEVLNLLGGQAPGNVGLRVDAQAKGITSADEMKLSWDYECRGPNQKLLFQVRTADDLLSLDSATYAGPGSQEAGPTWFESSCSSAGSGPQTATVSLGIPYKRAAEIQVKLTSDGLSSPVLHAVSLQYASYADLTVSNVTAAPTTLLPGGSLSATSTVQNIGPAAADSSRLSVYILGSGAPYYLGESAVSALSPGESVQVVTTGTIPANFPAGNYSIQSCADATGQVPERSEDNNCLTIGGLTVSGPDLVVTTVGPLRNSLNQAITSAAAGQRVTLSTGFKNQGQVNAAKTDFAVTLINASTGATYNVGGNSQIALAAGASTTQNWAAFEIPLTLPLGTYNMQVCADANNVVAESNENNNCATLNGITVYDSRDLVVKSVTAPASAVPGQPLTLQVTVENHAKLSVPDYNIGLYQDYADLIDEDSTMPIVWTYMGAVPVKGLAAGETRTYNVTIPLPDLANQQYYFRATADYDNKVAESDEGNNNGYSTDARTTVTRDFRDLVVKTVTAPANAVVGQPLTLQVTVQNTGNLAVANYSIGLYQDYADLVDEDSTMPIVWTFMGAVPAPGLAPGETKTYNVTITLPELRDQQYYFKATADYNNQVPEGNESNNDGYSTVRTTVIHTGTKDLVVQSVTAPANAVVGQPLTVQVTVHNAGSLAISDYNIGLYQDYADLIDEDSTIPIVWTFMGSVPVTGLAAGETRTYNVTITLPELRDQQYYFKATADYDNKVAEGNELNNDGYSTSGRTTVIHSGTKDLVVLGVTAPANAVVGQPLTVQVTVQNTGSQATPGYNIGLYQDYADLIDEDSTIPIVWTFMGSVPVTGLAAGETRTYDVTMTLPELGNSQYYFKTTADYDNQVAETNETNNNGYSTSNRTTVTH